MSGLWSRFLRISRGERLVRVNTCDRCYGRRAQPGRGGGDGGGRRRSKAAEGQAGTALPRLARAGHRGQPHGGGDDRRGGGRAPYTAHFEANGSGTTHSGNQRGTGNNIQDSGS